MLTDAAPSGRTCARLVPASSAGGGERLVKRYSEPLRRPEFHRSETGLRALSMGHGSGAPGRRKSLAGAVEGQS